MLSAHSQERDAPDPSSTSPGTVEFRIAGAVHVRIGRDDLTSLTARSVPDDGMEIVLGVAGSTSVRITCPMDTTLISDVDRWGTELLSRQRRPAPYESVPPVPPGEPLWPVRPEATDPAIVLRLPPACEAGAEGATDTAPVPPPLPAHRVVGPPLVSEPQLLVLWPLEDTVALSRGELLDERDR